MSHATDGDTKATWTDNAMSATLPALRAACPHASAAPGLLETATYSQDHSHKPKTTTEPTSVSDIAASWDLT